MVRKPGLAFLTTVALALAGVISSSSDGTAESAQDRSGGMTDISAQAQQKKGGPGRSAAPSGRSPSQPRIQRNVSQPRIQRNVGQPRLAAGVFGYMLYQERQKTTGIEINVGKSGISIEKN